MTVHVIGAGIAGLACAVRLARRGARVALYEQGRSAGGRCRSYFDRRLGRTLDNGIHLVMACQRSVQAFLDECGALDTLAGGSDPAYRFVDLREPREWTLRLNRGPLPWWIAAPGRCVPGRSFADMAGLARLAFAGPAATVDSCVPAAGLGHRRLWEPISVAWLNTAPAEASAQLLWRVVRDVFREGAAGFRLHYARDGLSQSFIDPAVAALTACGAALRFRQRVDRIAFAGARASGFVVDGRPVALGAGDALVLAVPPAVAARLVPALTVPLRSSPIATVHYALEPAGPEAPAFTCLVDERSYWLRVRGGVATVTVGAAAALMDETPAALAARLWRKVARVVGTDADRDATAVPPHRVLKFRHGTFAHTPADLARRDGPRTRWSNLFVAGDWTAVGRPALLDSAALSGHAAAQAVLEGHGP